MARVNIDILGTGMGEFNSDDHYIYYCGQESLGRNGVATVVNKRVQNAYLDQSQKQQNDLFPSPRQTIQYHSNPSLCPNQWCWRSWVEWFSEDLQDLLELLPEKDVLFILGDWNVKVGSQEIPGVTDKFGLEVQKEAGQRLTEFCQENTLFTANTLFQQHRKQLYTWTSLNRQYWNQVLNTYTQISKSYTDTDMINGPLKGH